MLFRGLTFLLLTAGTSLFAATCSIDGIVVNSLTGEPVPRAKVMIGGPATVADDAGKWSLTNIPCFNVRPTAQRPGFTALALPPMRLFEDKPLTGFRLELTPQAVITGRVTDDKGDPIMSAQVTVFVGRIADGQFTFQPTTGAQTNDLGEFRVPGLQKGKYLVCAGSRCFPGSPDGGHGAALDLNPRSEARVDLVALSDAHAVHVRGSVSGIPAGRGLSVSLVPRANRGIGMRAPASGVQPDGKFDIAGVTPGSYLLTADYFAVGRRMFARVPVEVGTSDINGLVASLEAPPSLQGIVRVETRATTAPPVPQFGVTLHALEPRVAIAPPKWDADRRSFTLADVTPGAYRLDLVPPVPYYVRSASLGGVDALQTDVTVNRATSALEIVLADDGGSLTGDVTNADGQPAASGILLIPAHGHPRIVNTQPDGHFIITGLAPGDYTISAWDRVQDVEYLSPDWMRRYSKDTPVTVTASQPSQLALKQLAAPSL